MSAIASAVSATVKPILVDMKNKDTIESMLAAANGRATAHAFSRFRDVVAVAAKAEEKLDELDLQKRLRAGAAWRKTSGFEVASAYRNARIGTTIELVRRTKGWYLVSAEAKQLHKDGGGKGKLRVTASQASAIAARVLAGVEVVAA